MNQFVGNRALGKTMLDYSVRLLSALGVTVLLVVFLVTSQWLTQDPETLSLHAIDSAEAVSVPAPPPPPEHTEVQVNEPPPPPPASTDVPELDLSLNEEAPSVQAVLRQVQYEVDMIPANFSNSVQPMKPASLFAAAQLDTQPRLLNRPVVQYPSALLRKGVQEGKVTLEVLINSRGKVTVRKVVSHSDPEFVEMATRFAEKAKFSPPVKDGRVVNAVFHWPLVLRP